MDSIKEIEELLSRYDLREGDLDISPVNKEVRGAIQDTLDRVDDLFNDLICDDRILLNGVLHSR